MSPRRGMREFLRTLFPRNEPSRSERTGRERERAFRDPVCGMRVDPRSRFEYAYGGVTYHFCSSHCLNQFRSNPTQYGRPAA